MRDHDQHSQSSPEEESMFMHADVLTKDELDFVCKGAYASYG